MGKICYFQKRYTEAEKYVKEYVRICSKRLGANHSDVACGWQNIATIYQAQGRFNYAEHAYKRALKGCIETIGENHPTTIKVKNSYANLLLQIDRIKEAEKLFPTADGIITGTWRSIDEYLGENNTEI